MLDRKKIPIRYIIYLMAKIINISTEISADLFQQKLLLSKQVF